MIAATARPAVYGFDEPTAETLDDGASVPIRRPLPFRHGGRRLWPRSRVMSNSRWVREFLGVVRLVE
jgi:hypothetical protein